jgi:carboxyl-terminal processing protease
MHRRLPHLVLALLLPLALATPAAADPTCSAIPELVRMFLRSHVRYHELTPEIEERATENYLRLLDPSQTLLTEAEVADLQKQLGGVFQEIQQGRCAPLLDLQKEIARRHEWAARYVREVVSPDDYAIDTTAAIVLDSEERGYPKTAAEREDLLRRLVHFQMSTYVSNGTELEEAKGKLIRRYERRYKRFLDITRDEIYSAFVDAFASSLDPHSNYLSAKVLEDFRIGMSLSLEGIGVALSEQDGYAVAERIIPGGAAERQGVLRPKDKIIAVSQGDGEYVDIIDMPLRDAVSLIRGKAGTKVGLTVLRQGDKTEKFNVEIVRDQIDLAEQAAKLRFEERKVGERSYKLAVLTLPSFYGDSDPSRRQCTDDVAKLLEEVKEKGADGLLLDLSRNGGGLLQHAVTISGFFIREGEVVGIEDSRGRRQILADRDDGILYTGPLVVHTSRVSASASEILAGALKDYGRAVIVGDDHTFGKGTVQTVTQLPGENGALKITTALFFRPGGLSTQHSGVEAHVVLPSVLAGDDYGEKSQRYSLLPQRTSPFLGGSINSVDPRHHWDPVGNDTLGVLAERSKGRVSGSEEFADIRSKLAEAEEAGGVVQVSELMKQREEEGVSGAEAGVETEAVAAEEDDEPTPQLEEALAVLIDLVDLAPSRAASTDAARPES